MARIKITGYLEIEDDECDADDPSGVTAEAYDRYFTHYGGDIVPPAIADLEDLEVRPA